VSVAEKIVHVAKNFLISADHEEADQVIFTIVDRMQRQGVADVLMIDILVNAAIGITGQSCTRPVV